MKTIIIFFLFTSLTITQVNAQFLGGLFGQQARKRKIMGEQIADLEIYLHALKGGYSIAENGLRAAHELKNGTFGLHTAYFNSLQQVNPVVLNDPKGKSIAGMHLQIITLFVKEITWQQKEKLLQPAELTYLQSVYNNILKEGKNDMDELTQVLTPGKLQLTDQQRLGRLDHLCDSMKDKFAFSGYFTAKCRKLATGRQQAKQENEQLKKVYGIH
ncbi:MAG: hypothetical protein JWQ66_1764 [Mucilaginibacter sp.]|nr:hypothetical protein [Mucilaginibacter sp.]